MIALFKNSFSDYLINKSIKKQGLRDLTQLDPHLHHQIKEKVRKVIKDWINLPSKGKDGFTCMHFAAYHGNGKLIKLLANYGANLQAKSI